MFCSRSSSSIVYCHQLVAFVTDAREYLTKLLLFYRLCVCPGVCMYVCVCLHCFFQPSGKKGNDQIAKLKLSQDFVRRFLPMRFYN